MAQQLVDKRDMEFVLWEQFDNESLLQSQKYETYNRKTCELMLSEARKIAVKELLPTMSDAEIDSVDFKDGEVKVPECFHHIFNLLKEGDWGCLAEPVEFGGQGAPHFITSAVGEYFFGANAAITFYLNTGVSAARMIMKFGTAEQKETYAKKMVSTEWGGTMLLTEPQAGSDVGALETTAVRNEDGTYSLTGSKIFITVGEHDLCDNIIHPVLARIEGAPAGTKGISIFIVPKYLVNDDGSLGERNDIWCTGVEHKHGLSLTATCSMSMGTKGKCTGYLLGEENQGMKIMFGMMNDARMHTGHQAEAYASAAYLLALNYARERIQGRELGQPHDAPSVAIINHPDVRRNLLWMKSFVDGMRSFYYYMDFQADRAHLAGTEEERELAAGIYDLLTPVIKSYLANRGYEVCVQAMQVYAGAGYTKDYLVEQYVRDCKIVSIYEGTCGIQAMDLLGRKLGMKGGQVFMTLIAEIQKTTAAAEKQEGLSKMADQVDRMVNKLIEVSTQLGTNAMGPKYKSAFAHSLPYLDIMGDTIMAWMLLWRSLTATHQLAGKYKKKDIGFYEGQIKTAEFFIHTIVPTSMGKMDSITAMHPAAIEISDEGFGGL